MMAYVTPPTFLGGDPLAADELNTLGDDIVYLYGVSRGVTFSGVQLNRTSSQSLATGTDTDITWQAEPFDYGGWWASGATITVPAGAIPDGFTTIALLVFARLQYDADATGNRRVVVLKNGTAFGRRTLNGLGGGDATDVSIQEVVTAAAGDAITVQGYQTAGHSLNVTAADVTVLRYAPVA
jgi:hypothetical protein